MLAIPRIAAGVSIRPVDAPDGLRYRLTPSHRGAGSIVPARTLPVLLLMDGKRTLQEIHRAITRLGAKLPDPAGMIEMVRLFEAAGIAEVQHHFATIAPIRHRCLRCGRSCEGHLVGPITEEEEEKLDQQIDQLRVDHPDIPEGPATVEVSYEGKGQRVLNFPGGACIFLSPDRLCRLHQRWGPHSKPLPCRMFPLRMIRTESGTRLTLSPRCYLAHRSYQEAAVITPQELMQQWGVWRPPALIQGLDPNHSESLVPTATFLENLDHEQALLALLQAEDLSLASVMGALADRVLRAPHQPAPHPDGPSPPTAPLEARLPSPPAQARFGQRVAELLQEVLASCFDTEDDRPLSRFGSNLRSLVLQVGSLDRQVLAPWNDIPPKSLQFVLFSLRNHLFSRGTMVFGSVRAGVVVLCMGVMAARWSCPVDTLVNGPTDLFVQHMTTWIRVMSAPEIQSVLFPGEHSCDELLALLLEP
ncbi:MAG: hypothetical protein JW797_14090 [Bradymonadales bacterium]|nr:hypothetical protein [Bradymonadales bacterium]